jgi:hypothetical protein
MLNASPAASRIIVECTLRMNRSDAARNSGSIRNNNGAFLFCNNPTNYFPNLHIYREWTESDQLNTSIPPLMKIALPSHSWRYSATVDCPVARL